MSNRGREVRTPEEYAAAIEPHHSPYIERWPDSWFVVLCTDGDCRRRSATPTVLGSDADKERAEGIRKAHREKRS